ncbi:DNA internalization-related competence protein ComEC/Rec2 [Periweissella beninensis]|uniref:DNA internalization-related competence protein ComEC/Rec2 n=1 Tax=Periweissella beninensis TaxID=504936 RepID=UPI0030B865C6
MNVIILDRQWWVTVLLCFWLIRIFLLREKMALIVSVLVLIIASLFFMWQVNISKLATDYACNDKQVNIIGTVLADEITFNGNRYKMILENDKQEKIILFGNINSFESKKVLVSNIKTLKVQARVIFKPIQKTHNDGQFDLIKYYKTQNIVGNADVIELEKVDKISQINLISLLHMLRKVILKYFEKLPKYLRFYAETLIMGYARIDFYQENVGIATLGLVHLFSISGFQVGLFCAFIRFMLKKFYIFQEGIAVILIILLPLYFIFSGSLISLIRPIITAMMVEAKYIYPFKVTRLDVWSCSLLGGVFLEPSVLLTFGGQLSYLLAFGLIYVDKLNYWQQILLLNLLTLPVILSYTYQWHILVLGVNLILLPFFSYIIVPITIFGVVTFPFLPILSTIINQLIKWTNESIKIMAELPGLVVFGKPPVILALMALICTAVLLTQYKSRRIWLSLCTIYAISFGLIHNPMQNLVTFIDVGQGDSAIIKENNKITLIDTGGKLNFNFLKEEWQKPEKQQQAGADYSVIPYLKSLGIAKINQIILTHGDADHIGDLGVILAKFTVNEILVGWGMATDESLLKLQRRYHFKIISVKKDTLIKSNHLAVLMPYKKGSGKNQDSVVTTGNFGNKRFIFMGDLDQDGEKIIMHNYPTLHAQIIKLGHHGSKTSTNESFIRQLKPELAIISAGYKNRYGHPHQETLKTLEDNQVGWVNTAERGMITYKWNMFGDQWHTKLRINK